MKESEIEFCKERARDLGENYKALSTAIKNYLYPQAFNVLAWLPDSSGWSIKKKAWYCLFLPYIIFTPSFNSEKNDLLTKWSSFATLIWGYYYVFLLAGIFSVHKILTMQVATSQNTPAEECFALIIIILFSVQGIISVIQICWYLVFNRKTHKIYRVLSIGVMLYLLNQFRTVLNTAQIDLNLVDNGIHFLFVVWVGLPFLFVASFATIFLVEFLLAIISYFVKAYSGELARLSHSLVFGDEKKPINTPKLISLPLTEIQTIKFLAQNSLEGIEKKTTPSAILLSVLAVGVAFTPLIAWIEPKIRNVLEFYTNAWLNIAKAGDFLDWFSNLFVFFVITIFILLLLSVIVAYVKLLGNLFTQSFLIEACIIAEYAKSELEREKARQKQPGSGFWEEFLNGLFSLFKK
jgi:hypothetical protein